MTLDLPTILESIGGLTTAIIGGYTTIHHIRARFKRKREKYRNDILYEAKEQMSKVEKAIEMKIKSLEVELQAQKLNVSKDFFHFKETHNSEIKVLGEKIESLREDLSQQHQALVGLLTKLVDR